MTTSPQHRRIEVKVSVTFECDDDLRQAVRRHYGDTGLATHSEMKQHFRDYGNSATDDFLSEAEEEDD